MQGEFYFISFSSFDGRESALRVAEALQAGEPPFPIWAYTGHVRPGEYWAQKVVEALKHCAGVIFVMTPDSVAPVSECEKEWSRGMKYQKRVIPLLFDQNVEPPLRLETAQHIDFTTDFNLAAADLRKHLQYCSSPEGERDWLLFRRKVSERDLDRAPDSRKLRIQDEISEIDRKLERLDRIIDDPTGIVAEVDHNIKLGLQLEQTKEKPVARAIHTKFINTPPALAPKYFQDRQIETTLISNYLSDESLRLLTIVGRGGVGKTAVICRLLKALETGSFPDGIPHQEVDGIVYLSAAGTHRVTLPNIFSDLTKLLPDSVAEQVMQIYKNPHLSIDRKVKSLTDAFSRSRTVLLLDNFEDVMNSQTRCIDDSELTEGLAALLNAPHHGIKTIITTRIAPGDLALVQAARQTRLDLDKGLDSPYAENILREMDRDGRVGLKHAPDNLLRDARERTNGNPRALEALFAILSADRATSLEDVLRDTEHLLPELVVETLVGEAFSRLDAHSQLVLQALAIYGRPVSSVAVDYLLQPYLPTTDSSPILNRLVNMHFVRLDAGCFYLHPIDASYALNRIPVGKPEDRQEVKLPNSRYAMWNRAGDYFKEVMKPRGTWQSLDDLAPAFGQFAMRVNGGDLDAAAHVLLSIDWDYLYPWGHYRTLIDMHEKLQAGELQDKLSKTLSWTTLGTAYGKMMHHYQSIRCFRRCIDVAEEIGASRHKAGALNNLALRYADLGKMDDAFTCLKQAKEIDDRGGGDENVHESILRNLGTLYALVRNTALAIQHYDQSLTYSRRIHARDREAMNLLGLGDVFTDLENWEEAQESYAEAQQIADEVGLALIQSGSRRGLAAVKLFLGDIASARVLAESALQHDVPENSYRARLLCAIAALRSRDVGLAKQLFRSAAEASDDILGNCAEIFMAHEVKALAFSGLGLCGESDKLPLAVEEFNRARSLSRARGAIERSVRLLDMLDTLDPGKLLSATREAAQEGRE